MANIKKHYNRYMLINGINVKISITKITGNRGVTLEWWGVGEPVDQNDSDELKLYLKNNHEFFTIEYGMITINSHRENPFSFECTIRGRT